MRESIALVAMSLGLLLTGSPALADIGWPPPDPPFGTVEDSTLFLEVTEPGTYAILGIEAPPVGPPRFRLDGTIRYGTWSARPTSRCGPCSKTAAAFSPERSPSRDRWPP